MSKYFEKLKKIDESLDKELESKGLVVNEGDDENTIEIPKDSLTPDQKKDILLDKGVDQKAIDNLKDDKEIDGALDATLNNDDVKGESVRDPLVDYLQEHANVRTENDCVDPESAVEMVSDILKIGHPYHVKDKLGFTRHFMQYGKSKYRFTIVRRTDKNMVIYKDDEPGEFYALDSNLTNEEFFKQIAGFIRKLGADKGLCESKLDGSDVSEEVAIRMDDDDLDMHGYVSTRGGKELVLTDNIDEAQRFQHEELGQNRIEAICNKFHYDPSTFSTKSLDPRADEPYDEGLDLYSPDEDTFKDIEPKKRVSIPKARPLTADDEPLDLYSDEDDEKWVSLDPMHPGATTLP